MKLIVGLGNPGEQYTYTRHNLGFLVLEALAQECKIKLRNTAGVQGFTASADIDSTNCSLLMPTTFMNVSGVSVKALAAKKGIKPSDILIVCDDLTLPFGQMRIRPSGSAGGHNGLKSIIEHLGSNEFARLRLGIGKPKVGMETVDYVLANFTAGEKKSLPDFINQALCCVHSWVGQGVGQAMNQFNKKDKQ